MTLRFCPIISNTLKNPPWVAVETCNCRAAIYVTKECQNIHVFYSTLLNKWHLTYFLNQGDLTHPEDLLTVLLSKPVHNTWILMQFEEEIWKICSLNFYPRSESFNATKTALQTEVPYFFRAFALLLFLSFCIEPPVESHDMADRSI